MRQIKLFLDMDQVLVDFKSAVEALGPGPVAGLPEAAGMAEKQVMYAAIEKAGEAFWSQMQWLPEGKKLWNWLISKNFHPTLLTDPGKFRWSISGKLQWIQNNVPGTPAFFEEDKYLYAERNSVLIDDMSSNIGAWENFGGTGILFITADDSIKRLTEMVHSMFPQTGFQSISSSLRDLAALIS